MLHTTNELQKKTLSYIIMYRNNKKKSKYITNRSPISCNATIDCVHIGQRLNRIVDLINLSFTILDICLKNNNLNRTELNNLFIFYILLIYDNHFYKTFKLYTSTIEIKR